MEVGVVVFFVAVVTRVVAIAVDVDHVRNMDESILKKTNREWLFIYDKLYGSFFYETKTSSGGYPSIEYYLSGTYEKAKADFIKMVMGKYKLSGAEMLWGEIPEEHVTIIFRRRGPLGSAATITIKRVSLNKITKTEDFLFFDFTAYRN